MRPFALSTMAPVMVGTGRQRSAPAVVFATARVAAYSSPVVVATFSETTVERTLTPGPTTLRPAPRCEKSATVCVSSIAPTETTPG